MRRAQSRAGHRLCAGAAGVSGTPGGWPRRLFARTARPWVRRVHVSAIRVATGGRRTVSRPRHSGSCGAAAPAGGARDRRYCRPLHATVGVCSRSVLRAAGVRRRGTATVGGSHWHAGRRAGGRRGRRRSASGECRKHARTRESPGTGTIERDRGRKRRDTAGVSAGRRGGMSSRSQTATRGNMLIARQGTCQNPKTQSRRGGP